MRRATHWLLVGITPFVSILCISSAISQAARVDYAINSVTSLGSSDGKRPFATLLPDGTGSYYSTTESGGQITPEHSINTHREVESSDIMISLLQ